MARLCLMLLAFVVVSASISACSLPCGEPFWRKDPKSCADEKPQI